MVFRSSIPVAPLVVCLLGIQFGCQVQNPAEYPDAIVADAATGEFRIELIPTPSHPSPTVPVFTDLRNRRISGLAVGGSGSLSDRVFAMNASNDSAGSRMALVPQGVAYSPETAHWEICMGTERLTRQAILNSDRVPLQLRVPVFPTGGCRKSSNFSISGRPDVE